MEWINAECCTGTVITDSIFDPLSTVTGNQLNAFPLRRCQFLKEALKYFLAESFSCPDYAIGIMVDNDGDVLVIFLVGGFVDSNFDEAVKSILP